MPEFTTTTLWFHKGTSNKIYQPVLEEWNGAWRLSGRYARRGGKVQRDVKGVGMSWLGGLAAYRSLVSDKLNKGYKVDETAALRAEPEEAGVIPPVVIPVVVPKVVLPVLPVANPIPGHTGNPGAHAAVGSWVGAGGSLPLMLPVQPMKSLVGKKSMALTRDVGLVFTSPFKQGKPCYVGQSGGLVAVWNLEGKPMALHESTHAWLSPMFSRLGGSLCIFLCYMDDINRYLEIISVIVLDGHEYVLPSPQLLHALRHALRLRLISTNGPKAESRVTVAVQAETVNARRQLVAVALSKNGQGNRMLALRDGKPEAEMQGWFEGIGWLRAPVDNKHALVVLGERGEEIILCDKFPWISDSAHAVRFMSTTSSAHAPHCESVEVKGPAQWARRVDCTLSRFLM